MRWPFPRSYRCWLASRGLRSTHGRDHPAARCPSGRRLLLLHVHVLGGCALLRKHSPRTLIPLPSPINSWQHNNGIAISVLCLPGLATRVALVPRVPRGTFAQPFSPWCPTFWPGPAEPCERKSVAALACSTWALAAAIWSAPMRASRCLGGRPLPGLLLLLLCGGHCVQAGRFVDSDKTFQV